ncbi:MAG: hypothetical protein LBQ58_00935 [Synergistaceae bacterium]|nr:hypothetical protein [Synergistaceae bacterium]
MPTDDRESADRRQRKCRLTTEKAPTYDRESADGRQRKCRRATEKVPTDDRANLEYDNGVQICSSYHLKISTPTTKRRTRERQRSLNTEIDLPLFPYKSHQSIMG